MQDPTQKKVIDANQLLKQLNLSQQPATIDTAQADPWGVTDPINLDDIFNNKPLTKPKRTGFLEGLNMEMYEGLYSTAKGATEAPQLGEAIKKTAVQSLAEGYINRLVKKGRITLEQAEAEKARLSEYVPQFDFLGIPRQAGAELPGTKMAEGKVNKFLGDQAQAWADANNRYDKEPTDYLKERDYGKAIGSTIYGIAESLPATLLAAFAGPAGAATLGVTTGAQKYDEVKDREDMSEAMKVIDGVSTGVFEWLFEWMGSAQMVKQLEKAYLKYGADKANEIFKDKTIDVLSKAYKKFGVWFAPVHEGLSEVLTTIGQNATAKLTGEDPTRKLMDGVVDSFLVGMGMGSVFAGTTKGMEALRDLLNGNTTNNSPSEPSPGDSTPSETPQLPPPSTPNDQTPGATGPLAVPFNIDEEVEKNFAPMANKMEQFRNRETGDLHLYQDQKGQMFYMLEQIDDNTGLFLSAETPEDQLPQKAIKGLAVMQQVEIGKYEDWAQGVRDNLKMALETMNQAVQQEAQKPEPSVENSYMEEWIAANSNPEVTPEQLNAIRDRVVDDMVNGQQFSDEFLNTLGIEKPEATAEAVAPAPPAEMKSFPVTFDDKKLSPTKATEQPNGTFLIDNQYKSYEEAEKVQKAIEKKFGHKGYTATIESKSTDETNPFADEVHSIRINTKPAPKEEKTAEQKETKPEQVKKEGPGPQIRKKKQWPMSKADESRITQDPASFAMAVYQFFLAGGRIKTSDFVRYTGTKPGSEEFRRMIWAISNDGVSLDVINQVPGFEQFMTGMEGMDGINAFIDVLQGVNGKNSIRERFDAMVNNQGQAPEVPEEQRTEQELTDIEEAFDEMADTILANPEVLSIFMEFSDDQGNIDFDRVKSLMDSDPGMFMYFPFQLTESEFEQFYNILNDGQQKRSLEELFKKSGAPEIKAQRDQVYGRNKELKSRTGAETTEGQSGPEIEAKTTERGEIIPQEEEPPGQVMPETPAPQEEITREFPHFPQGTRIMRTDRAIDTKLFYDGMTQDNEFVVVKLENPESDKIEYIKPDEFEKQFVKYEKHVKDKVTQSIPSQPLKAFELNSPEAIEAAINTINRIRNLKEPDSYLDTLTLPKEVYDFFSSLKKSETSKDIWSVYGKGFAPFNGRKIRDFFSYVNGAIGSGYGRNPGIDEKILKDKGFNLELVEKADADRIWFKNGVFLNIVTGNFKGDNTFYAGTQVSLRDVPYYLLQQMVDDGYLTQDKAYEILDGKQESPATVETKTETKPETPSLFAGDALKPKPIEDVKNELPELPNENNGNEIKLTKSQEKQKALEAGKAAFETGLTRVPIQDPALVALLAGKEVGQSKHILDAWLNAYDKANLAAPVPDGKEGELQQEELKADPNPTEAQKDAGNYQKGHISILGMDISIENAKGSIREGTDRKGNKWLTVMNNTYGYFRGTIGRDKDHVDVFIGDNLNPDNVYIIDQIDPETGNFDELKVMFGFDTETQAEFAYYLNYQTGWQGIGAISSMPITDFKTWISNGQPKNLPLKYNKPEKLVSDDRMAELRQRMKDKLKPPPTPGKVEEPAPAYARFDPEMFAMGAEMAAYHIESGNTAFEDFARAMIEDLGLEIKPFLKSFYNGARDFPGLDNSKMTSYDAVSQINLDDIKIVSNLPKISEDAQRQSGSIEPGSTGAVAGIQNNQRVVQPEPESGGQGTGGATEAIPSNIPDTETGLTGRGINDVVPGDLTTLFGQPGDIELHRKDESLSTENGPSDDNDTTTGPGRNIARNKPDTQGYGDITGSLNKREASVSKAPLVAGSLESIKQSVPLLLPEQQDDVLKAETRFYTGAHQGRGMIFTNGTGTGKTYSGLGIISRTLDKIQQEQNRTAEILIVVPSDQKMIDWAREGARFPITVTALENTKDKGTAGVRITTYANFTLNQALKEVEWDLIVYDESHRLMSDQKGKESGALQAHRLNANHPGYALDRQKDLTPYWQQENDVNAEHNRSWIELRRRYQANEISYDTYKNEDEKLEKIRTDALEPIIAAQNAILPELERKAREASQRTKVVFLSATPFNSHKTLEYVNKFVIDMGDDSSMGKGYNEGSSRDLFFIQNFGYRMRYNKLTEPDADVDVPALERLFFDNLVKQGAVSGRALMTEFDYSREFPIVLGDYADMFNEIYSHLNDRDKYKHLSKYVHFRFYNNLYSNQLFENLKSGLVVPRVKQHLELSRKVVVFHRYVNSGTIDHPFDFSNAYYEYYNYNTKSVVRKYIKDDKEALKELEAFTSYYPNATGLKMDLRSPITQLTDAFGDKIVVFNGKEKKSDRRKRLIQFNTPGSGTDILLIQEIAGREGIDLHDITGEFQRVIINLALPISPITALQIEGRINRIGLKSNAIFEYPVLNLDVERYHFGYKINNRVGTTENLAMGSKARDLRRAFKDGFLNADFTEPNINQGTGGKEFDKANTLERDNPFSIARSFYFTNQKKTSGNKSSEGIDYFATPEPVGFKMVEWSGIERGGHMLEPSAGHGAIARFAPDGASLTVVEPSSSLVSLLSVNVEGRIINGRFEDLDIHNKYDAITMNPPFGTGGKTAAEHLEKAFSHLRNGGRVVALIPAGASMEKRLEKMFEDDENGKAKHSDIFHRATVKLPAVTFNRAGTSVSTEIRVYDRLSIDELRMNNGMTKEDAEAFIQNAITGYVSEIDLGHITDINALFDAIENISLPEKVKMPGKVEKKQSPLSILTTGRAALIPDRKTPEQREAGAIAEIIVQKHTVTKEDLFTVRLLEQVGSERFTQYKNMAKQLGGYWSSFRGGGMLPGFIFKSIEKATQLSRALNNENNDMVSEPDEVYEDLFGNTVPVQSRFDFGIKPIPTLNIPPAEEAPKQKPTAPSKTKKITNPSQRYKLQKGEFSLIEVQSRIDGNFIFNGSSEIKTPADVAFLLRSLQTASTENVIIVGIKEDNTPLILHHTSGGTAGCIVDATAITGFVHGNDFKKVYMVHNHPSGNLEPSGADHKIAEMLEAIMKTGKIPIEFIIVDIDSGQFSIFNPKSLVGIEDVPKEGKDTKDYEVYRFDTQVFNEDLTILDPMKDMATELPSGRKEFQINQSQRVAAFISGMRLSTGNKLGVLVLNRHLKIVANYFIPLSWSADKMYFELTGMTARHNGQGVIFYDNAEARATTGVTPTEQKVFDVKRKAADTGGNLSVMDYVSSPAEPNINVSSWNLMGGKHYLSRADEGVMEPMAEYSKPKPVKDLEDRIAGVERKITDTLKQRESKKNELAKRTAVQGDMFAGSVFKPTVTQTSMFEVNQDASKENIDRILETYDNAMARLKDELISLRAQLKTATKEISSQKSIFDDLPEVNEPIIGVDGANRLGISEESLDEAKALYHSRHSAEEIWQKTGWERGAEGLWKREIGPIELTGTLRKPFELYAFDKFFIVPEETKLPDIINAPELFKAYPQLESVVITKTRDTSSARAKSGFISINEDDWTPVYDPERQARWDEAMTRLEAFQAPFKPELDRLEKALYESEKGPQRDEIKKRILEIDQKVWDSEYYMAYGQKYEILGQPIGWKLDSPGVKNTLIHEIQHMIQEYEGFAKGGNTSMAKLYAERWLKMQRVNKWKLRLKYEKLLESVSPKDNERAEQYLGSSMAEIYAKELAEIKDELRLLEMTENPDLYEVYKSLAGEVEARNAARRSSMTPAMRENKPPVDTEDIGRDYQLINIETNIANNEVLEPVMKYNNDKIYSNILRAIQVFPQSKATVDQWKAGLLKAGAKQAELDWMGWNDFVKGKNSLTDNEVRTWAANNSIKLVFKRASVDKPVPRGDQMAEIEALFAENNMRIEPWFDEILIYDSADNVLEDEQIKNLPEFLRNAGSRYYMLNLEDKDPDDPTKYSEYTLPGEKTGYTEIRVVMPNIERENRISYNKMFLRLVDKVIKRLGDKVQYPAAFNIYDSKWQAELNEEEKAELEKIESLEEDNKGNTPYKSSHWPNDPNIVVHIRSDIRESEGKKVYFIEEIQSDWAQKGKKEGFATPPFNTSKGYISYRTELYEKYNANSVEELNTKATDQELSTLQHIWNKENDGNIVNLVPDMPFKKTDQWVRLALRVALNDAILKGADYIAWTTGEQQNKRYDLSKQVDELWIQIPPKDPNKLSITGYKGDESIFDEHIEPSKLADYVGKEIADKYNQHLQTYTFTPGSLKEYSDYQKELMGSYGNADIRSLERYLNHPSNVNSDESQKYFRLQILAKNEQRAHNDANKLQVYKGNDLKVGGKGMIGFYGSPSDNNPGIIGRVAKEVFKQEPKIISIPINNTVQALKNSGGRFVIEDDLSTYQGYYTMEEATEALKQLKLSGPEAEGEWHIVDRGGVDLSKQHAIDITSALKSEAEQGLPMFVKSGGSITDGAISEKLQQHIDFIQDIVDELQTKAPGASKTVVVPTYNDLVDTLIDNGESVKALANVQKAINNKSVYTWAFYSRSTNTMYIIAEGTKADRDHIIETWLHEQIGHHGMSLMIPDKAERIDFLNELYDSVGEKEINRVIGEGYEDEGKAAQAEEYLAYLTGKVIDGEKLTPKERSVWQKILDFFKEKFQKLIGMYKDAKGRVFTDYDIARVIHAMLTKVMAPPAAATKETAAEILYHGTSHEFNNFSLDHVNTGVQKMDFGYGSYLTTEAEIARYYANQVASQSKYFKKAVKDLGENGKLLDKALFYAKGSNEGIIKWLEEKVNTYSDDPKLSGKYKKVLEYLNENPLPELRHIYIVGTHLGRTPDQWEYLDFYKPITGEQTKKINAALRREGLQEINKLPGKMVYRKLSDMLGGDKRASEFLLNAGIDGIKYPASKLYDDTDSGYNFVVFDPSEIVILEHLAFRKAPKTVKADKMINNKADYLYELFLQKMASVENLQKLILKRGGKITDDSNVMIIENAAASAARAKIDNYQRDIFGPLLNTISGILEKTRKTHGDKTVEKLDEYLRAKHSPERNLYMEAETGKPQNADFPTDEALRITAEYEALLAPDEIVKLWKGINKATDFTLQTYLKSGFLDQDGYNFIKKMGYNYYVPLRGWKHTMDDIFDYQESQRSSTGYQGMVKAKGRSSESAFALAYIQSMANTAILAAEKNKVKQAAAEMVLANKAMKDLFKFMVVYTVDTGQLDQNGKPVTYETVISPAQDLWDNGMVKISKSHDHEIRRPKWMSKQHEVQLFMNGQKVVLVFTDPNVANAINNTNRWEEPLTIWLQKYPGQITRWMSANFTAKNPAFMPINQIRDLGYAVVAHGIKYGTAGQFVANIPRARKTIIRYTNGKADPANNPEDALYEQWRTSGGETGWIHLEDVKDIEKEVVKELNRALGVNGKWDKAMQTWLLKEGGKLLENLAKRSENLSRYATFLTSLQNGRSLIQSVNDSKEITVNFNTKGRISGALGSLFAFFNAGAQGGYNFYNLGKKEKKKFMYVAAGFMALGFLSSILANLWSDDDENGDSLYDALGDFIKESNLVIPTGGRGFITIPMPFGFRSFYAWGVLASEYLHGKKTIGQVAKRSASSMMESLSPVNPTGFFSSGGDLTIRPLVPTLAVPPYDLNINEDFAGRRLYNQPFTTELEKILANSQQGLKYVSPYIKGVTDALYEAGGGDTETKLKYYLDDEGQIREVPALMDINPSKVEHLFDSYLGGRFQFWNQTVTTATGIIKGAVKASQNGDFKSMMDEVNLNTVPVLRRLYQEPWQKPYWEKYYLNREQIELWEAVKKQYEKILNTEKWRTMEQQNSMQEKAAIFNEYNSLIKDTYIMAGTEGIKKEVADSLLATRERLVQDMVKRLTKIDSINNNKP